MNDEIEWNPDKMLEVTIKQPDDFLKVRETLTRIGVASRKDKTLYQSCHILHKQGKYTKKKYNCDIATRLELN